MASRGDIELVVWRDANHALNDNDARGEYLNRTVGWVKVGRKWTRITQEVTGSGEKRGVTRVPSCLIQSRTKLVPQDVVVGPEDRHKRA